jgi:hypothetical protein
MENLALDQLRDRARSKPDIDLLLSDEGAAQQGVRYSLLLRWSAYCDSPQAEPGTSTLLAFGYDERHASAQALPKMPQQIEQHDALSGRGPGMFVSFTGTARSWSPCRRRQSA